jgi:hypothetical protein
MKILNIVVVILFVSIGCASAQYIPLPAGQGGVVLRQGVDKRLNGTLQITPKVPNAAATGQPIAYGQPCGGNLTGTYPNCSAPTAAGGTSAAQTTLAGTTAGSAVWSMPGQGFSVKSVLVNLIGYENTTATAQTITYPLAFTTIADVISDGGSCAGVTTTLTTLTLPSSMGGVQSGLCEVIGY